MYDSVRREIPEFLLPEIVYSDNLVVSRNERHCLLLTKNLRFFEFRRKQLQHCIDLGSTSLSQIAEPLRNYTGPNGKWYASNVNECAAAQRTPAINFGKYVYHNIEVRRTYVLLHCWDKLVALERCNENDTAPSGYRVDAQFNGVASFKLINSPTIKYQALLKLHFSNGATLCTDFQAVSGREDGATKAVVGKSERAEFRQQLERLRNTQTELQVHKALTQKELQHRRNEQTFGTEWRRSFKLEEKQLLARCGDIWMRFSAHDWLVIGVPLVNNCSPPNLSTPRNLRPLFDAPFNYQHRLYQLEQRFDNLETLDTFLQSASERLPQVAQMWCAAGEAQQELLPDSFAVLLIKLNIAELIALNDPCSLVLLYDVDGASVALPTTTTAEEFVALQERRSYEHQLWLRQIDFAAILSQRLELEVSFRPASLHQDLLAVVYTAVELNLLLAFAALYDLHAFRRQLADKFGFTMHSTAAAATATDRADGSQMRLPQTLCYNQNPASIWFGCLMLEMTPASASEDSVDHLRAHWKLYGPSAEKVCLLLKLLFNDLLLCGCNVLHVECPPKQDDNVRLLELESALRQELQAQLELLNNADASPPAGLAKCEELFKLQLHTDLLAGNGF